MSLFGSADNFTPVQPIKIPRNSGLPFHSLLPSGMGSTEATNMSPITRMKSQAMKGGAKQKVPTATGLPQPAPLGGPTKMPGASPQPQPMNMPGGIPTPQGPPSGAPGANPFWNGQTAAPQPVSGNQFQAQSGPVDQTATGPVDRQPVQIPWWLDPRQLATLRSDL